jgi:hypothetical protein
MVSSSYSTSDTRRVNQVTNVFTTSGTYAWSIVTQIFHNGQPSHGDDCKTFQVITSTYLRGTLGAVGSLLTATLYQGNSDRNHKRWNIASTGRYILHMQCCWNVATYEWKVHMGQLKSSLLS